MNTRKSLRRIKRKRKKKRYFSKEIYQAKYLFHVGAVSNFIRDFKNARIL